MFWILSSFSTQAGNPDKAFESLRIFDYFNAKKYFEKSFKKFPAISSYGLAYIYSKNDNPFYNTDSAFRKINEALSFLTVAATKEKAIFEKYKVAISDMQTLQFKIINDAFLHAEKQSTISGFNHFIDYYGDSHKYKDALRFRDSLAFEIVRSDNTSESYGAFMEQYPESHLYYTARSRFERALYNELTAEGTPDAYEKFTIAYPRSPHFREAHEQLFKVATKDASDPKVYHDFIKKYPSSLFIEDAWQRVFELSIPVFNEQSLQNFRLAYPDYPYQDKLMTEFSLIKMVLLPYEKSGKYGFINSEGTLVIDPVYDFVEPFAEGMAVVGKDGKSGYVTKTGDEVIPPFYQEAENFHNNLAVVGDQNKFGVIDRNGQMIIPLKYTELSDFSEGLAAATENDLFGYIDRDGMQIINPQFDIAGDFADGFAICQKDENFGLIDQAGNELLPFIYQDITPPANRLLVVKKDDSYGVVSLDSGIVIPFEFSMIKKTSINLFACVKNGKLGFINASGEIQIPFYYLPGSKSELYEFTDGFVVVNFNGKYGVIDSIGRKIIPFRFDEITEISSGKAAVRKGSKWAFIDLHDRIIPVKFNYNKAFAFHKGFAIVEIKSKWGVIDEKGMLVISPQYDELKLIANNVFVARRDSLYGLIDPNHNVLVPVEYEKYTVYENEFVLLMKAGDRLWYNTRSFDVIRKESAE